MKKILTIVFDGFGMREEEDGNAIKAANMHTFNKFYEENPHTLLYASEERVGLLEGQMGNSEVGHSTIGAGRVIKSALSEIKDFFMKDINTNETFKNLVSDNTKRVHLMGLCSDGNIHSNIDHFKFMYLKLINNGFKEIYFHLITDGRDTKVDTSKDYIKQIDDLIKETNIGTIASICGRYYAMDRDSNFDRTEKYYNLITKGEGNKLNNPYEAINLSYKKGVTDEFISPIILDNNGVIKDNDIVIWLNYRADRGKQILKSLKSNKFNEFDIIKFNNLDLYSFYPVDKDINSQTFFEDHIIDNPLGLYLSKLGLKQARIAETEKYAHVTYFFDGEYEGKVGGCDKFLIPSPDVATYDLKPEMSATTVTKKIIDAMEKDYEFIFANFANPDMVGHTGNMKATTEACMTLDICLNKIIEVAEDNFYTIILLADHGNADTMINQDGTPCTTHSLAMVPFIINDPKVKLYDNGDLSNVAPTILDYMDIAIPKEMTSDSLLVHK